MLWNLDIFGKSDFEICLVRVDYWYLWKTHFLSFGDFQESPSPLKIPIYTPASDWGGPVAWLSGPVDASYGICVEQGAWGPAVFDERDLLF